MPNQFDAVPMPIAFWSQVNTSTGPKGCWIWQGRVNGSGYGGFNRAGYGKGAHRVAYFLGYGQRPAGYVLHSCDTKRCCNPTHLFLGSQRENIADMNRKGRGNHEAKVHHGSAHGRAKLTEADVLAIRSATANWVSADRDTTTGRYKPSLVAGLAKHYGVSLPTIYQIISRRIWRHV